MRARYDAHDAALEWLGGFGPELVNGFTSHAPMVVEALAALGRPDAVAPWLAGYAASLRQRPAPRAPIEPAAWRDALGREERRADWMALLRDEVGEGPWRPVLRRWLVRLAPAFCADALHGPIRVAHATRALEAGETPARRRELADALGAWAAAWQTLPLPAERRAGTLAPEAALAQIPLQPEAERGFRGSIVSALAGLAGFAAFVPVIDALDVSAPEEQTPGDGLTRLFDVKADPEEMNDLAKVKPETVAAMLHELKIKLQEMDAPYQRS